MNFLFTFMILIPIIYSFINLQIKKSRDFYYRETLSNDDKIELRNHLIGLLIFSYGIEILSTIITALFQKKSIFSCFDSKSLTSGFLITYLIIIGLSVFAEAVLSDDLIIRTFHLVAFLSALLICIIINVYDVDKAKLDSLSWVKSSEEYHILVPFEDNSYIIKDQLEDENLTNCIYYSYKTNDGTNMGRIDYTDEDIKDKDIVINIIEEDNCEEPSISIKYYKKETSLYRGEYKDVEIHIPK